MVYRYGVYVLVYTKDTGTGTGMLISRSEITRAVYVLKIHWLASVNCYYLVALAKVMAAMGYGL